MNFDPREPKSSPLVPTRKPWLPPLPPMLNFFPFKLGKDNLERSYFQNECSLAISQTISSRKSRRTYAVLAGVRAAPGG